MTTTNTPVSPEQQAVESDLVRAVVSSFDAGSDARLRQWSP